MNTPTIPDFDRGGGLVAAVAQDAESLEVLMLAWMDRRAWELTLATGEVHYYSRSRKTLWHKGATSGHVQKVRSVRVDCDRDAVLLLVEQKGGAACHEGYRSCFYRELRDGESRECSPKVFDPKEVYG
jgi:phosphoribosyl-AMP cyclohydrolase